MPLTALRVGEVQSGVSEVLIMEHKPGLNYSGLVSYFETKRGNDEKMSMTKKKFRQILSFAQRERERERDNQICSVYVFWALCYCCSKAAWN